MPDGFRPVAKAIVGFLLAITTLLVAVGLLDVEVGKKITLELLELAGVLGLIVGGGVYATRNSPR